MAIEFHCDRCGKLVRAPENAGGRHGKCPSCHQSVYIPTPDEQIEPLDIEPLDSAEERRRQKLIAESRALEEKLLHERSLPKETAGSASRASSGPLPPPVDVERLVTQYALAMAQGKLEEAAELAALIRRNLPAAEEVMQRLTIDEMPPPALERIPRPVLVAFFKQLRER